MIVQATKEDERALCEAFKTAVQQNPLSFQLSVEDIEAAEDLSEFLVLSRYFDPKDKSALFIEKVGDVVEGTASIEIPIDPRFQHNATTSWLWVANHRRGTGLSTALMKERSQYMESLGFVETLHALIVSCQTDRIEGQLQSGFEIVGTLKNDVYVDGVFYDMVMMQKTL